MLGGEGEERITPQGPFGNGSCPSGAFGSRRGRGWLCGLRVHARAGRRTVLNHLKNTRVEAMRAIFLFFLLCPHRDAEAAPAYFASVANQALKLKGGASIGPDLSLRAVVELEQQVKRVMGADPALELNVSALRDRSDPELLRVLFLAVLGNFTSGAGSNWQQPCSLVVDPRTGLVALEDTPALASLAQKVVLMLLVAVQFKQWVEEVRAQRLADRKASERKQ